VADLSFAVTGARPERHAAVPILNFRLSVREASGLPVHAILLRCQLQIQPRRRRHAPAEQARLADLFGTPERWGETVRPLLWTQTSLIVPAFEGTVEVDLPLACTYDFEVTSARYVQALESGDIPLLFLFSGTVFEKSGTGFQVTQVPWDKEAGYRLPVAVWRELMDQHFPGCTWMRIRRENRDAIEQFKESRALLTFDDAIEALVRTAGGGAQ
jgi:hypothetical protein